MSPGNVTPVKYVGRAEERVTRLLFFSRGRGHGHAVRDLALWNDVCAIDSSIDVTFVSYGTGAETFRRSGISPVDLDLPDDNTFVATAGKAYSLLQTYHPDGLLVHEEPAAILAAYLLGRPAIYMSSWLPPANTVAADALRYAQSLIVFAEPGLFMPLSAAVAVPKFVGPLVRPLHCTRSARNCYRKELAISDDTFLICVMPGGGVDEVSFPFAPMLLQALQLLKDPNVLVLWCSEKDFEEISKLSALNPRIRPLRFMGSIECVVAASDLVVTKGNRGATIEAAELGVPSISVSQGTNPIDDFLIATVKSNVGLNAHALTPEIVAYHLDRVIRGDVVSNTPLTGSGDARRRNIADLLVNEIRRCIPPGDK